MSPTIDVKIISALTGPSTLTEVADRVGIRKAYVLAALASLIAEGTVKQQGNLFWLARQ